MIQDFLEKRVIQLDDEAEGVLPSIKGHSLHEVPGTVAELLGSAYPGDSLSHEHTSASDTAGCSKVVLFYVDGISYDFVKGQSNDIGFLGRMLRKGIVSPITAVFPTTTAASCTSLNTGLTTIQHTLLEWQLYFHETGALMYTLPFRAVTSKYSKQSRALKPDALFQGSPVYSVLRSDGVKSYVLVNRTISRGTYSDLVFAGATVVPYSYITDCIIQLRNILEREKGRIYVYVYLESADSVSHTYGPDTEMYAAEVSSISRIIKYELLDKISPVLADDTAVILTTDHGQVAIDPEKTFYLNNIEGLWDQFEIHNGRVIPPVGSPRDLFLHVREDRVDHAVRLLDDALGGTGKVLMVEDAVNRGLFGSGHGSKRFYNRSGNLMILPDEGKTVWYTMKGQVPMHLKGLHGGITRDETIIPFGISRLSRLL